MINTFREREMQTLPEIVLDVNDTDLITDELYELLLDAFVARARDMGIDIVERRDLVLGQWTLTARLEYV